MDLGKGPKKTIKEGTYNMRYLGGLHRKLDRPLYLEKFLKRNK